MFKRLVISLAALLLAGVTPAHAAGSHATNAVPGAVIPVGVPSNYAEVWRDDFNGSALDCKKNGPLQWNRDTGSGTWSSGQTLQSSLQGSAGQMAEYVPDCQWSATVGAGYPSQGELSVSGGILTITAEPTPASVAASLPTTYAPFVATCSASATDMSCTALASGTPKALATFTGTGVSANTQITAYGTNASASGCTPTCHYTITPSQTFSSTTVTGTGKWPYVAGWISTQNAVGVKPPYCMVMRAQLNGGQGSWGTAWTQTRHQNINTPTNGEVEFDDGEYTPTVLPKEPAFNYHWHADDSGGTYFNAGITRKLQSTPENGFSTYTVCAPAHVGQPATWIVNGLTVSSYVIPTSTVYEGQYHYPIIDLSIGNDPGFPGIGSGTSTMKIDYIGLWKPIGSIKGTAVDTGDYFVSTAGDGLGAERIFGSPATGGGYSGGWVTRDANSTGQIGFSSGSAVDGLPVPAIIHGASSGGSILDGREWSGNTTFGAAVNNQAYQFVVDYNYAGSSPSNAILVQIYTPADGTFYRGTVTGTTPTTLQAGGGCTPTITTVGSHKHLVCTFTAGAAAAGIFDVTAGPDSTSGSHDVTVYDASIRPTSQIFP